MTLGAALLALSVSFDAQASEEVVDPRYAFNLELGGTVGSASIFGDVGYSQFVLGGFLNFAAPVAENRKVTVGLRGVHGLGSTSAGSFEAVTAGYRILSDFEPFQTRLDLQLVGDLSRVIAQGQPVLGTRFAVGPRAAIGGLYSLGRGWRIGAEVSAMVVLPRPRAQFELNPLVSWSW